MNLIRKILIIISLFLIISTRQLADAQELFCRVQVAHQSSELQGDFIKRLAEALQKDIYEFMNNRKWTNHVYSNDERIECNIFINLTDQITSDEFKGTIQIQSNRPVFNSTYNSVMFNYLDKNFHIHYTEYQPLEFNETAHISNLTSILAFYTYIILGLDYDSYSLEGGYEYFKKAETIVNNAQNAQERGWKAYGDTKNRYWLVENISNEIYNPIRECIYRYHRLGLDIMTEKPDECREEIIKCMELLQKVHKVKPGSFLMQLFFTAKADELVNIFSEAFPDEKNRVSMILNKIDPANIAKYSKIKK